MNLQIGELLQYVPFCHGEICLNLSMSYKARQKIIVFRNLIEVSFAILWGFLLMLSCLSLVLEGAPSSVLNTTRYSLSGWGTCIAIVTCACQEHEEPRLWGNRKQSRVRENTWNDRQEGGNKVIRSKGRDVLRLQELKEEFVNVDTGEDVRPGTDSSGERSW